MKLFTNICTYLQARTVVFSPFSLTFPILSTLRECNCLNALEADIFSSIFPIIFSGGGGGGGGRLIKRDAC